MYIIRKLLMAKWLKQASQWHEMYCHELGVMTLNPSWVELWVRSTSVQVILDRNIYYVKLCAWGHYCVSYVVWWRYAFYSFKKLQRAHWNRIVYKAMFTLIAQTTGWCSKVSILFFLTKVLQEASETSTRWIKMKIWDNFCYFMCYKTLL